MALSAADLSALVDGARQAVARADWPTAFGHWENIRLLSPDNAEAQLNAAVALRQLGHLNQADAILGQATEAFPLDRGLAIEYARNAFRAANWITALGRWQTILDRFPDDPEGAAGVGGTLQLLGRLDEADSLLTDAVTRFPDHAGILVEYARVPHRRNDWPEAFRRWALVSARCPDNPEGYAGAGVALQLLGRLDEAETLLAAATLRFPAHAGIAIEYARIPHRQSAWPEALRRWNQVITRCPDMGEGPTGASIALRALARFDDADTILAEAMTRFPASAPLRVEYARVADERLDWNEARRRWQSARAQFPDDGVIREGLGNALFQLDLAATEDRPREIQPRRSVITNAAPAPEQIMMQFESLGSGCEFGLVQRHHGAEPLGLLRWGGIAPGSLVRALDTRFEGVGSVSQTVLFEHGDMKEYFLRDTRFQLEMHTFIRARDASYERVLNQQIRRAQYLREKLLNDLDEPTRFSKIFVYKPHLGRMSDIEAQDLHRAVRRYGDHALLVVQSTDAGHNSEIVEAKGDGLLIGYLSGLSSTSNAQEIQYQSWLTVCEKALVLRGEAAL